MTLEELERIRAEAQKELAARGVEISPDSELKPPRPGEVRVVLEKLRPDRPGTH